MKEGPDDFTKCTTRCRDINLRSSSYDHLVADSHAHRTQVNKNNHRFDTPEAVLPMLRGDFATYAFEAAKGNREARVDSIRAGLEHLRDHGQRRLSCVIAQRRCDFRFGRSEQRTRVSLRHEVECGRPVRDERRPCARRGGSRCNAGRGGGYPSENRSSTFGLRYSILPHASHTRLDC